MLESWNLSIQVCTWRKNFQKDEAGKVYKWNYLYEAQYFDMIVVHTLKIFLKTQSEEDIKELSIVTDRSYLKDSINIVLSFFM